MVCSKSNKINMRVIKLTDEEKIIMLNMPPLAHWPDRSKPYKDEDSQCLQYVLTSLPKHVSMDEALDIWNAARQTHCVIFSPKTKVWTGAHHIDAHPAAKPRETVTNEETLI